MKLKQNILKVALVLSCCFFLPTVSQAQIMASSAAITAKIERPSLAEGIVNSNQGLLLNLVTKAGLMPVLSNSGSYTFFAPSEEALTQLQNKPTEELRGILSQHIVKGVVLAENMRDGTNLKTLGGGSLRICRKKGALLVDGVRLKETDQQFSNGVWHQMNGAFQASASNLN